VILALLVVLVGGLIAYAAGQVLTRHTQVLAVSHDVPLGSVITDADLVVASVTADPNLSPIPASQRSEIVGLHAQVALVRGELLTRAQVGAGSGLATGQVLVALPVKQGQFPARGLTAGQKVLVVATPGTNATTSTGDAGADSAGAGPAGDGAAASEVGIAATVAEVGGMNPATQLTVIDVQVPAGSGVAVAQLASTENLSVILLPTGP
jgi:hypothetical protein